jgi:hypothetical protein
VSTTQSPAAVAPERRAAPPNSGAPKASDAGKQDFYWRRQAEKLEKELAALRSAEAVELNRLRAERADLEARAQSAEAKHNRLQLLVDSGLPKELAELVPEGNPEEVAAFVEKLKPVAEKLARPAPAGTLTNPPNRASSDSARLEQLAAAAARGDKSALREYAALREKVRGTK